MVVQARKAGKSLVPHVDYERLFTSTNMVQVSAGLQPRGGKAPPVLAEYMSTTSLSICPGTAAQLLPELRQVFSFHDAPKDSILKHVVDLSLSLRCCRPPVVEGVLRMGAAIFAAHLRVINGTPSFSRACSRSFTATCCTVAGFH